MNLLKEKIAHKKPISGAHVMLGDPCISELMGMLGYDFIWVDMEHSSIDYDNLVAHLIAVKAAGASSLVRTNWTDISCVKRVLEAGPDAVLFPMVNTAEDAMMLMRACIYPPVGTRGYGPVRASKYGIMEAQEYTDNIQDNLCRFIQIETETAIKNLKEIVKNPYIDAYIFGPSDLASSIGQINRVFDKDTSELIDEAIKIIHDAGKPAGVSTASSDPEILKYWVDKGMDIISAGTDYVHILNGSRKVANTLQEIFASRG